METADINKRILRIRKTLELSQEVFSRPLSIPQTNYSKIENLKRNASVKTILRVSDVYKVDLNWLMRGYGEPFSKKELNQIVQNELLNEPLVTYGKTEDCEPYKKLVRSQEMTIQLLSEKLEKLEKA